MQKCNLRKLMPLTVPTRSELENRHATGNLLFPSLITKASLTLEMAVGDLLETCTQGMKGTVRSRTHTLEAPASISRSISQHPYRVPMSRYEYELGTGALR